MRASRPPPVALPAILARLRRVADRRRAATALLAARARIHRRQGAVHPERPVAARPVHPAEAPEQVVTRRHRSPPTTRRTTFRSRAARAQADRNASACTEVRLARRHALEMGSVPRVRPFLTATSSRAGSLAWRIESFRSSTLSCFGTHVSGRPLRYIWDDEDASRERGHRCSRSVL